MEYQVQLSNIETEAMAWGMADHNVFTDQLEGEIYHNTSNEQMQLYKVLILLLVKWELFWEVVGIQEFQEIIQHYVIYSGYSMLTHVIHVSDSNRHLGASDSITWDISKLRKIRFVNDIYRSSTVVSYIHQMCTHHVRSTSLDLMSEKQS